MMGAVITRFASFATWAGDDFVAMVASAPVLSWSNDLPDGSPASLSIYRYNILPIPIPRKQNYNSQGTHCSPRPFSPSLTETYLSILPPYLSLVLSFFLFPSLPRSAAVGFDGNGPCLILQLQQLNYGWAAPTCNVTINFARCSHSTPLFFGTRRQRIIRMIRLRWGGTGGRACRKDHIE